MSSVSVWIEVAMVAGVGSLLGAAAALLEPYFRVWRRRGLHGSPHRWNGTDGTDGTDRTDRTDRTDPTDGTHRTDGTHDRAAHDGGADSLVDDGG